MKVPTALIGCDVGPDPRYHSWSLTGTGVEPVTVGPGGETDWVP
jgi:hypothetical protein